MIHPYITNLPPIEITKVVLISTCIWGAVVFVIEFAKAMRKDFFTPLPYDMEDDDEA